MVNLYFISAQCHQSNREQGYQFAPTQIKEKYDFELPTEKFSGSKIDLENGHEICKGYELLYEHIKSLQDDKKIITIGGDNSISAATIAAMNEKYMVQQGQQFDSSLKILWIDCFPDIDNFYTSGTKNLNDMPVASLLGLTDPTFVPHKLLIKPEQIVYFGLASNIDTNILNDIGIEYYTDKKIKQLGNESMINILKDYFDNSPIHVVLDMKVFNGKLAPCVDPINANGLEEKDVISILSSFKNDIVAMDVTEFNPYLGKNIEVANTKELIKKCLMETFPIKEKNINIINENTKFLISRPSIQESLDDYGWYILAGVSDDYKEKLMKSIADDEIITIDIDEIEYLVTKTNMNEQNEKSYYTTVNLFDTVLFPNEKISMVFELVNSNNVDII
jgi:arginase family enzyme